MDKLICVLLKVAFNIMAVMRSVTEQAQAINLLTDYYDCVSSVKNIYQPACTGPYVWLASIVKGLLVNKQRKGIVTVWEVGETRHQAQPSEMSSHTGSNQKVH